MEDWILQCKKCIDPFSVIVIFIIGGWHKMQYFSYIVKITQ